MTHEEALYWLAINIYHEARGECLEGQVAVGQVTMNRVLQKHKDIKSIIFAPYQFSWANGGKTPPITDYEAFWCCLRSARCVFDERVSGKDLWKADHYFNPHVVLPSWAEKMTFVAEIGNHRFYRS